MKYVFLTASLLCLSGSICLTGLATGQDVAGQDDFAAELPRVPPTSPKDAMAAFQLVDGFQIQQLAAEPLLASPVAIQWDETGLLYVCEMRGYSEQRDEGLSRIATLSDLNGDGVYDKRVEFADGLSWPTAIFPWDGGLFVGDAPDILYLKDTDGDGKADERRTVLTGFGTSNVQGLLNSFRWDLDNRIHVACSSVGGKVRRPDQEESEAVDVRGRDIAFDPKTMDFELTSGAAQHGMTFDDWGRKFVCSNSDHIQQVMYEDRYMARNRFVHAPRSRVSIAADGPQAEVFRTSPIEPWRIVRTRLRVGGVVPGPIEGGGRAAGYFTGATGLTIYRGDQWPERLRGAALIGDVGSNLIHRKQLSHQSIHFTATRIDQETEFVTSSDIWFRPAQFEVGPDGALTVIDVCREVIEHPKSLPPQIKKHLDLTAGRDRGRLYRVIPSGFEHRKTPDFSTMKTAQLIAFLTHENSWHRETASRLLSIRGLDQSAKEQLIAMTRSSPSAVGRMHALYVLDGHGVLDAETVLQALHDAHDGVRRHAVRLSERVDSMPALLSKLCQMAADPSVEVRYQLAFTMGEIDCDCRSDVLSQLARNDAEDPYFQAAIHSSLGADASRVFVKLLREGSLRSPGAKQMLVSLAEQVVATGNGQSAIALQKAMESQVSDSVSLLPIVSQFLKQSNPSGESEQVIKNLRGRISGLVSNAVEIAVDTRGNVSERRQAIDALASMRGVGVDPSWCQSLCELIDPVVPGSIQRSVIDTVGKVDSKVVCDRLLNGWDSLSPGLRNAAIEVMFSEGDRTKEVFDRIDAGDFSVHDLPRQRLEMAVRSRDREVSRRAKKLLDGSTLTDRAELVQRYRECLTLKGEVDRGRAVFAKHCASCHRIEGVGHQVGPNLKSMVSRGAESILVNVLDPSREVNPQYLNYVILTDEGRTITGMVDSENASSIVLKRADSASESVLRSTIERLESTGESLMPSGLEKVIDPQAMADLIAYLMQE